MVTWAVACRDQKTLGRKLSRYHASRNGTVYKTHLQRSAEQSQNQSLKSLSFFHCSSILQLHPTAVVRSLVPQSRRSLDFCRPRTPVVLLFSHPDATPLLCPLLQWLC